MKAIIGAIKALWATLKDPHLLSSRPHHGDDNRHCHLCGDYIMPLDWCGCDDPNDANYKGNLCPNCGRTRMKCECVHRIWWKDK